MSYDPTLFNVDPYYDDFNEDKKFLRIMFKPGYALQAREVTQMQTILQNQIERFGSNIFENGSVVLNGQVTENYLRYGRITGLTGVSNVKSLIGGVVGSPSSANARIVHAEPGLTSSVDGYPVIFFEYLGGGGGFTHGTVISGTAGTNSVSFSLTGSANTPALGDASVVAVDSGVRYVDGYFVMHDAQMIGAYTLTGAAGSQYRVYNNPSTRVGFVTNPSFVSASDDETLNDPAFGYYNYAAPGADRFKLDLQLAQYAFDPSAVATTSNFARGNFIEVIRIVNGETVKKELYPEYAVLEDTLARRTYDESGNYTVEPFDLNVSYRDIPNEAAGLTLSAELGQGKAYIYGYEFETQGTTVLPMAKARSESSPYLNQKAIGSIGPSIPVVASGISGGISLTGFNPSNRSLIYFSDGSTGATFNYIGSARVHGLIHATGTPSNSYNLYLHDVSMTGSNTIANATRIFMPSVAAITGGATAQQAFYINWNGATGTYNNSNSTGLLFLLPKGERIKTLQSVNYATSNFAKVAIGANGSATVAPGTITTGTNRKTFSVANTASFPYSINSPSNDLFVLSVTGAPVGFTANFTTNNSLSLSANAPNRDVYVFYTTDIVEGENYSRRKKTLVTETIIGATASFQTDPLTGRQFIYIGKGATAYADVVSVTSITGTKDAQANNQLLNYFTFDDGQRDYYYDWSRLLLTTSQDVLVNEEAIPPFTTIYGPFNITLTRFDHGNQASAITGPFTVDSYVKDGGVAYENIPTYTSPSTGISYRLSDVLDFRYVRQPNGSFNGYVMPAPAPSVANDNLFSYKTYLPRTDKIILTRDRNLRIISGIPSIDARPPVDSPDAMTLYTVTLNGYTTSKNDVQIKRIENKRYTMQDIGELENRVDAVEYYSNLNILEQQVRNSPFLDSNGLEVPKKGILVDGFGGHAVSDVQDPMYSASIDFENGEMRPAFRNRVYRMNVVSLPADSGISASADGIYTLGYSTTPLINQPLATSSLNINPAGVFNYLGFMRTTPSSEFWYDDSVAPSVRINTEGENDAWLFGSPLGTGPGEARGFGLQWNDWESNWSGIPKNDTSISSKNSDPTRSIFVSSAGYRLTPTSSSMSIIPNSLVNNVGDVQIRSDIVPYARSIDIGLSASNLRPNTTMYAFIDGQSISTKSGAGVTSDSAGNLSAVFSIPRATLVAGKKNIRVSDSPTNDLANTTTAADYLFSIQGTWGNFKDGIVSTRTVQTRRESVRTEKIVTNTFNKDIQRSKFTRLVGYTDPLSQSFYVDPSNYPSGIFTKKITLFFKNKDSNPNVPVTMILRPVVGGYPHPSKVIPLSDVTIQSSNIVTTTDASVGTDFVFSSPVYLTPGEYSFSLITPSNNFELFSSQIGLNVIKKSQYESTIRATKQPHARYLFKNQTSTGVQKTDTEDIKFLLHLCKFNSSSSFTLGAAGSGYYGSVGKAHSARYNVPFILPANTVMTTTENGLIGSAIDINKTTGVNRSFNGSTTNFTTLLFGVSTNDPFVSPIIDIDRANVNLIENRINGVPLNPFAAGEEYPNNFAVSEDSRAISRYITKRVVLESGMEATNLRVEMLASYPVETNFKVYARMSPENGTGLPFDLRGWTEMTAVSSYTNTAVGGYQEMAFKLTGQSKFKVFAIKIVMTSSDSAIVPKFKNLRISAA